VPLSPSEGVDVLLPGRTSCSLHAGGKADRHLQPMAGVPPRADWHDAAAHALQTQRALHVLGLSWADVVRKPPTRPRPAGAQRPGPRSSPHFHYQPELYLHWWPKASAPTAQPPTAFPVDSAARPRTASSLQLLMAYLPQPSERWLQGLAHQFVQAPSSPAPRFTHRGAQHGH